MSNKIRWRLNPAYMGMVKAGAENFREGCAEEERAEEEIQKEIQKAEPVVGICLKCFESRSLVEGHCEDCR